MKHLELFAGIGGFRRAMDLLTKDNVMEFHCVGYSEIDIKAELTYRANYNIDENEFVLGDIVAFTGNKKNIKSLPKFDLLTGGFPCQTFSMMGSQAGFEEDRGQMFFRIMDILAIKKPKYVLLENVKNLRNHDKGRTLKVILNTLREDLDYYVPEPQIINAKDFGVPQNRERIFIVGFNKNLKIDEFKYPNPINKEVNINDIIEDKPVSVKYYLSTQYLNTLEEHKKRHEMKGNGFGYEIISKDGIANAIVVGGMGRERNLIIDGRLTDFTPVTHIKGVVNRDGIRRMTPREWARLQGFPDEFIIDVSDAQAYKQFGNSVAVPAVQATAKGVVKKILRSY